MKRRTRLYTINTTGDIKMSLSGAPLSDQTKNYESICYDNKQKHIMMFKIGRQWSAIYLHFGYHWWYLLQNHLSALKGKQQSCAETVKDCTFLYWIALQIYTVETGTPVKQCKSYKYLPYTLQCRSVDVTVNHCESVFTFFH